METGNRTNGMRLTWLPATLLLLAGCGWLVLIANMFGLAGRSGWLFPVVTDIPGLGLSTLLLALLGMTQQALGFFLRGKGAPGS